LELTVEFCTKDILYSNPYLKNYFELTKVYIDIEIIMASYGEGKPIRIKKNSHKK